MCIRDRVKAPVSDTSKLSAAIAAADALNEADYTAESWAAMKLSLIHIFTYIKGAGTRIYKHQLPSVMFMKMFHLIRWWHSSNIRDEIVIKDVYKRQLQDFVESQLARSLVN